MNDHVWLTVGCIYAVGGLFLLLACFVRIATKLQWSIQSFAGLAPRRLIENEERYFGFMRACYLVTAAFLFALAYLTSSHVRVIDDQMRKADRLSDAVERFYDKRSKEIQHSLGQPNRKNDAGAADDEISQ